MCYVDLWKIKAKHNKCTVAKTMDPEIWKCKYEHEPNYLSDYNITSGIIIFSVFFLYDKYNQFYIPT